LFFFFGRLQPIHNTKTHTLQPQQTTHRLHHNRALHAARLKIENDRTHFVTELTLKERTIVSRVLLVFRHHTPAKGVFVCLFLGNRN